jgi:hypothetical protein
MALAKNLKSKSSARILRHAGPSLHQPMKNADSIYNPTLLEQYLIFIEIYKFSINIPLLTTIYFSSDPS